MNKIYNFQIDLSDMPTEETVRSFTVTGDRDSEFIIYIVEDGTIKYYDWVTEAFELGHNDTNNNLKVTISGKSYSNNIKFPSGGGTYVIKLLASEGTEVQGTNKHIISKSITKQTANAVVTFKAATTNTANYDTFPTTTSTGGSTSVGNFDFNWDIVNASTDAGGFGLRLTGDYNSIVQRSWYFTTTDTVNGAITSSTTVVIDDLTDIVVGMIISGVSSGSLSGEPTILSIDTTTKTLTLNAAQTFADGITLTFKARGSSVIKDAIGLDVTFTQYPTVTPTLLTQSVRADVASSTTVTLSSTHGVAGGNLIRYSGVGVNNSSGNLITSVTPDCPDPGDGTLDNDGLMVVQLAQDLAAGTVLTFHDIFKTINFTGNIVINSYPDANRTIYLDLDRYITVGADS